MTPELRARIEQLIEDLRKRGGRECLMLSAILSTAYGTTFDNSLERLTHICAQFAREQIKANNRGN